MDIYENIFVNIKKIEGKILCKDILYTKLCKKNHFINMYFVKEDECTVMKFPTKNVGTKEEKVQKQNYNCFIYTIAEMIKKYMLDIEE